MTSIEDAAQVSFTPEALFMRELRQQLLTPTEQTGLSAILRIRLDSHVPIAVAFDERVSSTDLLLPSLERLQQCLQPCDLLTKQKPGIILVLLRNLRCEDDLERIRERVVRIGERPFRYLGNQFLSRFSVGAAMVRPHRGDAESLIREATCDMHRGLGSGLNWSELFTRDFAEDHSVPSDLESYVRYALRNQLFRLSFQPQYTRGGGFSGLGVLTQMQIPGAVWLKVEHFLPWLEDCDLALEISRQGLKSLCLQAGDWLRRDIPIASLSIEIPTAHFLQEDFVPTVSAMLEDTGLPGSHLEFGLSESTIMTNVEETARVLAALSAKGVRFCVCGCGLAPFPASQLRNLPIQALEVDCSNRMMVGVGSIDVSRAIVAHGRRHGLITRAKDVQTEAQRTTLLEAGCNTFQGPLISQPIFGEEVEQIILCAARL